MGKTKKIQEQIERRNPFKAQEWGKKKFVPKVPNKPKTERVSSEAATPWKNFKDEILDKQREEEASNKVDMNSAAAKEALKKREQNYRRMLITEQAKQPTKWETFDDTHEENTASSRKRPNAFAETLEKAVDPKNFDARNLNFKQNNTLRKILTKGICSASGSLAKDVKVIERKKLLNKERKKKDHRR